jgi:UDP-GlcNAc3NAcA epimerase
MSDVFFTEMEIPEPDINFYVGSGNHKKTGLMFAGIEEIIIDKKPNALVGVWGPQFNPGRSIG